MIILSLCIVKIDLFLCSICLGDCSASYNVEPLLQGKIVKKSRKNEWKHVLPELKKELIIQLNLIKNYYTDNYENEEHKKYIESIERDIKVAIRQSDILLKDGKINTKEFRANLDLLITKVEPVLEKIRERKNG